MLKWGKDNIDQFDIWELRELISMYWFCRNQGFFDIYNLQNEFPDVKFVSIDDIKHNFVDTITNCLNYFSKENNKPFDLNTIKELWLDKQIWINADTNCDTIVNNLIRKQSYDWSELSINLIDEAYIQKKLADNGIQIKCYNLNSFPTNTEDFLEESKI